jgi:hypothetical protein
VVDAGATLIEEPEIFPGFQVKVYPGVPPTAATTNGALCPVQRETSLEVVAATGCGSLILVTVVPVHPLASVTITEYMPAQSDDAVAVSCGGIVLHK